MAPIQSRHRMMGGTSGTTQAGGRWARRSSLGQADPEPAGFHAHRSPPATHLRSTYYGDTGRIINNCTRYLHTAELQSIHQL